MNKALNKRGRGRPPKKGKDLGRKTYIQEIIEKSRSEASSHAATRVRVQMKSEWQSVEQLVPSTVPKGILSTTEDLINRVSVEETLLPSTEGEEITSRGSEGLSNSNWEEEPPKGFSSPRDQGSTVKFPVVKLSNSDLEREFLKDFESPRDQRSAVQPPIVEPLQILAAKPVEILSEYWRVFMEPVSSTIYFPIGNITGDAPMRPIPLTTLPSFHGLSFEDPDMFLFEFDIACRGYDYIAVAQKLKKLPTTLKGTTLRWFMGLGGSTITSWEGMKLGEIPRLL